MERWGFFFQFFFLGGQGLKWSRREACLQPFSGTMPPHVNLLPHTFVFQLTCREQAWGRQPCSSSHPETSAWRLSFSISLVSGVQGDLHFWSFWFLSYVTKVTFHFSLPFWGRCGGQGNDDYMDSAERNIPLANMQILDRDVADH